MILSWRASTRGLLARSCRRPCLVSVRSFSGGKEDAVFDVEAAKRVKDETETTVRPWFKTEALVPRMEVETAFPDVGSSGKLSHIPPEQLARQVRIYKAARHSMQSGTMKTHCWNVELANEKQWVNTLMGYQSGGDPFANTGLRNLKFDTLEDAKAYCVRQGWDFAVDRKIEKPSFDGKKGYHQNFLNYHVATRRKRLPAKKFAREQFDHPEAGKSCWVNLKHTDYGETESKMVSQTHWKDEDHPNNHDAESWRYDNFEKKAELAKRLGK